MYYESNDIYYCLHSGIIIPMKKKNYPTVDDALSNLDDTVTAIFKDSKILQKTMLKQHSIQFKLYELLTATGVSSL